MGGWKSRLILRGDDLKASESIEYGHVPWIICCA
jgi:hypothetical protein